MSVNLNASENGGMVREGQGDTEGQNSIHPDLQDAIEVLKQNVARENCEEKGEFPRALKPQLAQLALLAIRLNEYDERFFAYMGTLFLDRDMKVRSLTLHP